MSPIKVLGVSGSPNPGRARRHGSTEQVAEYLTRFGLMYGMVVGGDPVSEGYFGIASLQGDEGWRRASGDILALKNA
jgi:hypothetical protein